MADQEAFNFRAASLITPPGFWEWTDKERVVWEEIRRRHGVENAISAADLALVARTHARDARRIVRHLRTLHRLPIASAHEGYYYPWSDGEKRSTYRFLVNQALSTLTSASAFRKSSKLDDIREQLRLELEVQSGQ